MFHMMELLRSKMHEGVLLFATHDVELACCAADRILFLEEGRLVFDGHPDAFIQEVPLFATEWTQFCRTNSLSVFSVEALLREQP